MAPERISLLQVDPALGAHLPPKARRRAAESLVVPALRLKPGIWDAGGGESDGLGYLVVTGLLTRAVGVSKGRSVELLGPLDVLRPWQEDAASFCESEFSVLQTTTLAKLDGSFVERLCEWPGIVVALSSRMLRRSRSLAVDAAISNIVGVEDRVLILLWHVAERWGHVTREGVVLDVQLSQQLLSELAGTRRQTVSTALGALQASGRLRVGPGGRWMLVGDPPC